jgi:hypothetical protein
MNKIVFFILPLLLLWSYSPAETGDQLEIPECEIIIDDFRDGINPGWTNKSFHGETEYTWVRENGKTYIRATSSNAASGLVYRIKYDPAEYPYITWTWKADKIIDTGDATIKSKDDYSARIYIVFPSLFFWNTKVINYIWANKLPQNEVRPSPYMHDSIMISVESGSANTGKWLTETRNLYEDYLRTFGRKPPKTGAIAIMTDTDDTGQDTSAGYGPIAVCSRDPEK